MLPKTTVRDINPSASLGRCGRQRVIRLADAGGPGKDDELPGAQRSAGVPLSAPLIGLHISNAHPHYPSIED